MDGHKCCKLMTFMTGLWVKILPSAPARHLQKLIVCGAMGLSWKCCMRNMFHLIVKRTTVAARDCRIHYSVWLICRIILRLTPAKVLFLDLPPVLQLPIMFHELPREVCLNHSMWNDLVYECVFLQTVFVWNERIFDAPQKKKYKHTSSAIMLNDLFQPLVQYNDLETLLNGAK